MAVSELCIGGVVLKDGRILLVKRGHKPARGFWSIPGGRVEPGETLEEAVKREMLEECGVDVEVGDVVCVAEVVREGKHYVIVDFTVEFKNSTYLSAGGDAVDLRWFELEDAASRSDVVDSARELCKLLLEKGNGLRCPYIKEILEKL